MDDLSLDVAKSPPETNLFSLPWEGRSHSGTAAMFWKNGFLSCNGRLGPLGITQCYHLTLGAGAPVPYPSMNIHRSYLAYALYQEGLWVTGGHAAGKLDNTIFLDK